MNEFTATECRDGQRGVLAMLARLAAEASYRADVDHAQVLIEVRTKADDALRFYGITSEAER